eukprot:542360-Pyramimonas_sp.AAC.1
MKGVFRCEDKFGKKPGCYRVSEVAAEAVGRQSYIEDSRTAPRGQSQVDETYRAAAQAASLAVTVDRDVPELITISAGAG